MSLKTPPFTPDEDAVIYREYAQHGPEGCLPHMPNREKWQITNRAKKLGQVITAECVKARRLAANQIRGEKARAAKFAAKPFSTYGQRPAYGQPRYPSVWHMAQGVSV